MKLWVILFILGPLLIFCWWFLWNWGNNFKEKRDFGCPGVIGSFVYFPSDTFLFKFLPCHKWAISLPPGVPQNQQDAKNLQGWCVCFPFQFQFNFLLFPSQSAQSKWAKSCCEGGVFLSPLLLTSLKYEFSSLFRSTSLQILRQPFDGMYKRKGIVENIWCCPRTSF